jgi:hypothetical protein
MDSTWLYALEMTGQYHNASVHGQLTISGNMTTVRFDVEWGM